MSQSFRTQREDVVAKRKASGQSLRIVERRPFPGDIHPFSKSQLGQLLELVPAELIHGLRAIELCPRNHEVGNPFARYRGQAKTVILYSLPDRWQFDGYFSGLAADVSRAGASVTREGQCMQVEWPNQNKLRLWYFFEVLGHELGHHFDRQFQHKNGRSPNRRAAEQFAELSSRNLRDRVRRMIKKKRTQAMTQSI